MGKELSIPRNYYIVSYDDVSWEKEDHLWTIRTKIHKLIVSEEDWIRIQKELSDKLFHVTLPTIWPVNKILIRGVVKVKAGSDQANYFTPARDFRNNQR